MEPLRRGVPIAVEIGVERKLDLEPRNVEAVAETHRCAQRIFRELRGSVDLREDSEERGEVLVAADHDWCVVELARELEPLLDRTDAGVIPGDGLRCPDGDEREGLFRQLPGLIVAADVPEVPAA